VSGKGWSHHGFSAAGLSNLYAGGVIMLVISEETAGRGLTRGGQPGVEKQVEEQKTMLASSPLP
jgi:hypothetical protein